MKKTIVALMLLCMMTALTACGTSHAQNQEEATGTTENSNSSSAETESAAGPKEGTSEIIPTGESGGVLVAYFSWADNTEQDSEIDAISSPSVTIPGDVAQLANWVQEGTGGDIFSIRVTEPYPSDWDACLERGNQEKGDDARPELVEQVENLENYDTIFLGYPNWWYSAPMAIFSFLEENNLAGKSVYLFCSHGTGGLAGSVQDISAALPDSTISGNVFDVYEEDASSAQNEVEDWLSSLGF